MTSDKAGAALLTEIFVKKGLQHIVISPGSRNAPLILSFAQHPNVKAISIVDERSAAFFALGMALQTKKTVAISCTSGSAALNYAPAIAEAYYQKIPLLVITADRPLEMIDQGDGQTIRQKNVYANYIKASFEIPGDIESDVEIQDVITKINEAINLTMFPDCGPVHINIPFREPLYNQVSSFDYPLNLTSHKEVKPHISGSKLQNFANRWNSFSKKLIIAGMMDPNSALQQILQKIQDDPSVVLLSETTSNLGNDCSCSCIDKVVNTIKENETEDFRPELLVTFGGHVVSKMVKAFLRKNKPVEHWHIDIADVRMDTYQSLTEGIPMFALDFFNQLSSLIKKSDSTFKNTWRSRSERSEERHKTFLDSCKYSDLKVFETILRQLPERSTLHLGNSTPVRYAQLFKPERTITYFSNRGVSGIDGTVSTTAGAAYVSNNLTTLITGDLGFLYDSNALMNHHLTMNLRFIIINNGGGGIFRFIPGPDETGLLETFFEAHHNWNAKYVAKNFKIPYFSAGNLDELNAVLTPFLTSQKISKPAILEIFTPGRKNAKILRSYFKYLKE